MGLIWKNPTKSQWPTARLPEAKYFLHCVYQVRTTKKLLSSLLDLYLTHVTLHAVCLLLLLIYL